MAALERCPRRLFVLYGDMCCALHPCVSRSCSSISSPARCSGSSSYGSIATGGGVQRRSFDPLLVASDCSAASCYLYIIASAPDCRLLKQLMLSHEVMSLCSSSSGSNREDENTHCSSTRKLPVQFVQCANEIQSLAVWCGSCVCAIWAWTDIEYAYMVWEQKLQRGVQCFLLWRWGNNKKREKVNSASGMPRLTLPLDLFLPSDSLGHGRLPKQYTSVLPAPATATLRFLSFTFLFTY